MKPLKSARYFQPASSEQDAAHSDKAHLPLQGARQFAASDFVADVSLTEPELPSSWRWPLWLFWTSMLLLLWLGGWQWLEHLQHSWQQGPVKGGLWTVISVLFLLVLGSFGWREWRLWRRLQQNQQWQQAATRIANSVQFGEAQPLCQSIAAALPQDALSAGQLLMWQKAVTAEHTDQEQLQLFDTLVLAERDKQAQQLIWRASTDCSLAVAISPFALADMLLVIWRSSRMLRQLAVLYGSPVGQLRSLAMLKRALAALLWAGGSELVLDMAADAISSDLTAKLSMRAGQGVIAGLLVARLGQLAQQQLRPLPLHKTAKVNMSALSQHLLARVNADKVSL